MARNNSTTNILILFTCKMHYVVVLGTFEQLAKEGWMLFTDFVNRQSLFLRVNEPMQIHLKVVPKCRLIHIPSVGSVSFMMVTTKGLKTLLHEPVFFTDPCPLKIFQSRSRFFGHLNASHKS